MLGRLALKKVPLQVKSVAPKNNDHLKEVEKDEYPTHLSVRKFSLCPCSYFGKPFDDNNIYDDVTHSFIAKLFIELNIQILYRHHFLLSIVFYILSYPVDETHTH